MGVGVGQTKIMMRSGPYVASAVRRALEGAALGVRGPCAAAAACAAALPTATATPGAWRQAFLPLVASSPGGCRAFASSAATPVNIHVDADGKNTTTAPFEFGEAFLERANEVLARYPENYKQSAVIPLLDLAQQQNKGFLSLAAMDKVALLLGMPAIRVYEVATFYSMFNRQPVGRFLVQVCGTTPCMLRGSRELEEALIEKFGIGGKFETSKCGTFTLSEMECMGCCVNAPMVAVADYSNGIEGYTYNYYEDLDAKSVVELMDQLKDGTVKKVGSVRRDKCEPFTGQTTLLSDPPKPSCRKLEPLPPPPEQK